MTDSVRVSRGEQHAPDPPGGVNIRTLWVPAAIFLTTAAFTLVKTARDALYLQGRGLFDLPGAYLGAALLALPLALIVLGFMRVLGSRRTRVGLPLVASAFLFSYYRSAHPGGGPAMTVYFLLVPLVFGVVFSLAWLLVADLLDRASRVDLARAYSRIGTASILGGTFGGESGDS